MACDRLTVVLDHWTDEVGKTNLVAGGMPAQAVRPFEVDSFEPGRRIGQQVDEYLVADAARPAPAVGHDRGLLSGCRPRAGEKERGTLETLFSSPAERSEIVLGKLLRYDLQHDHGRLEPGLRGSHRRPGLPPERCLRRTAGLWRSSGWRWPWSPVGPLQRPVPGPGLVRPQYEGRPLLPHAALDAFVADGHAADDSGRGTEPGQQPDSHLRRGAAAEDPCWKAPTSRPCNTCRWCWP